MSAVGQWRMRLMDFPEYAQGYALEPAGDLVGEALLAWQCGREDREDDDRPRPGEP